jgi:outer membrane protein TolC
MRSIGTAIAWLVGFGYLAATESVASAEHASDLRVVRLAECVRIALSKNTDVRSADDDMSMAEASRASTRGRFGPRLQVDASATRYDSAYILMGLPVHDAFTWSAMASLTQPITPLLAIYDEYKISELGVNVAAIRREAIRRDTAQRVVEGYYRLMSAERLSEVTSASVEQLQGQLRQASSFHSNGVVSQDDVLRAQLAVANAQQRAIQAKAQVALERSRLAMTMGLSPDTQLEPQPLPIDASPARDALTLQRAEELGLSQRVEAREVDQRIAQSEREVDAAWLKLAPQINLVAAYVHNEGSAFSPPNSGYVGGAATWDVWDWGSTTSGIPRAKAHHHQALLGRAKIRSQIDLEIRQAYVTVEATAEAMAVALASVAVAEENFRLVKKRYEASAATSFDVVDAEALLTQARAQRQTSLYDFLIARSSLRRAIGEAPEAIARP